MKVKTLKLDPEVAGGRRQISHATRDEIAPRMDYSDENDLKEVDLNFTLHGSNKHQGFLADDPHDHHDDKELTSEVRTPHYLIHS